MLWLQNMLYLLQQQYPADLMPLLAEYSQGALHEAVDAFPTKPSVISSNLTLFATAVEVPHTPVPASLSAAGQSPDVNTITKQYRRYLFDRSKACAEAVRQECRSLFRISACWKDEAHHEKSECEAACMQGLMRISDYQRRRILHLIKHFKSVHKQQAFSGSRSSKSRAMRAPLETALAADRPDLHRAASEPQSGIPQWGTPHACAPVSLCADTRPCTQ